MQSGVPKVKSDEDELQADLDLSLKLVNIPRSKSKSPPKLQSLHFQKSTRPISDE